MSKKKRPAKSRTAGTTAPSVAPAPARAWWSDAALLAAAGVPLTISFWGYSPYGPPKAAVLMALAAVVCVAISRDRPATARLTSALARSRLAWALGALLALAGLAALTSPEPDQSLLGTYPDFRGLVTLTALAAVAAAGAAAGLPLLRRLARFAAVATLGAAAFGALQATGLVAGSGVGRDDFVRVTSTLGNASNFGVFLAVALPVLLLGALRDASRTWRVVSAAAAVAASAMLVLCGSRGAWLGAMAGTALGVVMLWPALGGRARLRYAAASVAIPALLCASAAIANPALVERAASAIDSSSRTVARRLSIWRSSARMVRDRPFLGFGPNAFQYAYPAYREEGQVSGSRGYQAAESAHNVFLDVTTSTGVLGLALAVTALAAAAHVLRRARPRAPGDPVTDAWALAALSASLAAGFVALQFHYLTLDTGPLLALLAGVVISLPAEERPATPAVPAAVRRALLAAAVAFLTLAGLFAADAVADSRALIAMRAAARGDTAGAAVAASSAVRLAPWEPGFLRLQGTAAGMLLDSGAGSEQVAAAGISAFDRAVERLPSDPALLTQRANLLLMYGARTKQAAVIEAAAEGFRQAAELDPANGLPVAGLGASQAALGDTAVAAATLERAVTMSPGYRPAWRNLAAAYAALGRDAEAKAAGRRRLLTP